MADVGCVSQASCCRENKGSEGTMLNLMDALFTGTLFRVLMLSVAGGDGLVIRVGMGVKDSNIKKGTFMTAYPKPTCGDIQPCAFICDGGGT